MLKRAYGFYVVDRASGFHGIYGLVWVCRAVGCRVFNRDLRIGASSKVSRNPTCQDVGQFFFFKRFQV